MIRAIWAALACAFLAACSTTALEPQGRALNGQYARIYVMWPNQVLGGILASQDVLIDEQSVGKVGNGSYLSVDRPAGRHKITIKAPIGTVQTEYQFHAAAGRVHYFVLNLRSMNVPVYAGGIFVNVRTPGTSVGRPVDEANSTKTVYLAGLDAAAGKALLAKLDKP